MRSARKQWWVAALFALSGLTPAVAMEVGGVTFEKTQNVKGQTLVLNGAGVRNKYFVDVYAAGLYLPTQSLSAEAIIRAKDLQSIRLVVTSSQITRDRLIEAITDGIRLSAGSEFPRYEPMLGQLWEALTFEVQKGDVFDFTYVPNEGVHFIRNGALLRVMPEFEFKKILFGIWLGQDPVQPSLKEDLLSS